MRSYYAYIILVFLLAISLYPPVSMAQDVRSQAVSAGPGVERRWSDLQETMNISQEQSGVHTRRHKLDLSRLQTLKNQPFQLADNLPSSEVDRSASPSGPQSLAPTLLRNFEGPDDKNQPDGYLHRPPDPHIAVGLDHVGVMVNSEVAFYNKNGTLVSETSFRSWWSNVYFGDIPFDPRITYDHHADRWLMVALVLDEASQESWYLLSVSQTSDPTGAWWNYKLDGSLYYWPLNTWADYPDLGFDGIAPEDGGAIYITSNQFDFVFYNFWTSMLNILPKSALYSGAALSYWRAWDRTNEDGSKADTLRAAHTFGNPGGEFIINSKYGGGDNVTLWRVNPTFPPTPVDWVRQATIIIGSYSPPPEAEQLGTILTLDTIDNRIYNAMYRNGYLYAAFTEAYDWGSGTVAAIRYLKIDTNTNNADIDERYGADGYYYWFPTIYTDSSDNIVMVFARSSPTEYAGIHYTGRKTTDSAMQPSALLKAGETYMTGYRWGDYFGIASDPSDGSKVWIYGEWAKDCPSVLREWDWGTWIGEVSFATRDVAVTDVVPSKTVVGQGYNMSINVTVTNEGGFTETFNVSLHANLTEIETQTVNNLSTGTSAILTFTWNTTGFAYGNYTISAVADTVPGETDTADNTLANGDVMVTIPGDVNGDRIVDIFDIGTISAHWYPGPPVGPLGYHSNADINNDGEVNIFDVGIASAHWEQSW